MLVEVTGLEPATSTMRTYRETPLWPALFHEIRVFAIHYVRGSARKGTFEHTLSPVESRRGAGAMMVLAVSGLWPRDPIICSVQRRNPAIVTTWGPTFRGR